MCELPYYCHICSKIVHIENEVICPICRESFLEVYQEEEEQIDEYPSGREGRSVLQRLLGLLERKKKKSIGADRRNYAIGPEIHDIISRMMEDKQIKENPATKEQKSKLVASYAPEGETCMICLNAFEKEEAVMYPCAHFFHGICSDAWIQMQCECPVCRKAIT
ncbi:hypothetical protein NEFER03_0104 [Nematocida sp. LUAm3]|nr:hypothetical protein NEFER03_0104 [Nematocida sp. LUAm3]KAI5173557.1 hypothetical protein NEFER02_0073 [Nematocida sp. LUAm2]KAI5176778.1 hypothetical protein NEFER01_0103 [Nematocida sp. LUAm1]